MSAISEFTEQQSKEMWLVPHHEPVRKPVLLTEEEKFLIQTATKLFSEKFEKEPCSILNS